MNVDWDLTPLQRIAPSSIVLALSLNSLFACYDVLIIRFGFSYELFVCLLWRFLFYSERVLPNLKKVLLTVIGSFLTNNGSAVGATFVWPFLLPSELAWVKFWFLILYSFKLESADVLFAIVMVLLRDANPTSFFVLILNKWSVFTPILVYNLPSESSPASDSPLCYVLKVIVGFPPSYPKATPLSSKRSATA